MGAWICEKCGQKFPPMYRERHLKAHERVSQALREYETTTIKYDRKADREEKKSNA